MIKGTFHWEGEIVLYKPGNISSKYIKQKFNGIGRRFLTHFPQKMINQGDKKMKVTIQIISMAQSLQNSTKTK